MKSTTESEYRCTVAVDGPRMNDLHFSAQELRREIARLNAIPEPLIPSIKAASRQAQAERRKNVTELTTKLKGIESELDKLQPRVAEARKQVAAADASSDASRRAKCSRMVEQAATKAATRQAFVDARAKLSDLNARLVTAEHELGMIERTPPTTEDATRSSAEALLETGSIPAVREVNQAGREKELRHQIRTLAEALRLQSVRVRQAERTFCSELAEILRPDLQGIAQQIAGGLTQVQDATKEAALIRVAVAVATGGADESLPAVVFPDAINGVGAYIERLRSAGWAV